MWISVDVTRDWTLQLCLNFFQGLMCVELSAASQLVIGMWILWLWHDFFLDIYLNLSYLTATEIAVNIMAVTWLIPGYLSESLLPHSYWNGCEHYGCDMTYSWISIWISPTSQLLKWLWTLWLWHDLFLDIYLNLSYLTATEMAVNIMAVTWLIPGYLSESLLPHSYWNGCEHYGCDMTYSWISIWLLPHSYWNGCEHYGCDMTYSWISIWISLTSQLLKWLWTLWLCCVGFSIASQLLLCLNYFVCLCVEISPSCCRWFEWYGCAVTSLWICCVSEFLLPAVLARDVNVIGCVLLDPFFLGLWCIWNSVAPQLLPVV